MAYFFNDRVSIDKIPIWNVEGQLVAIVIIIKVEETD